MSPLSDVLQALDQRIADTEVEIRHATSAGDRESAARSDGTRSALVWARSLVHAHLLAGGLDVSGRRVRA